jgi:predicted kinase
MEKKNKIILTVGLQASGKSSFAKMLVQDDKSFVRINRDDFRDMLTNMHFSNQNEALVTELRDFAIFEAIKNQRNIIVDETGFSPKLQARLSRIAYDNNYEFIIEKFEKDVELCIQHDALRPKPVGAKVILRTYRKYIEPKERKVIYDKDKPDAIISDIDGTVSLLNGRNPYDTASCLSDGLNSVVAYTIKSSLINTKLIFVTGRYERFRDVTVQWLNQHFSDYELFMRPDHRQGNDYLVKQDILERDILPRYNVLVAYEDRPRCTRMYRQHGIQVLHCGLTTEW